MKRNPRNEDLYTVLREELENFPWLGKVLDSITDCEVEGNEVVIIVDKTTGNGIKIITRPDPASLGNIPVEWREMKVLRSSDEWDSLTTALARCEDSRILRQADLVLVECTQPTLEEDEAIARLKSFTEPEVLCYYGWEE
ncbi:MAG: hypothetical protein ACP5I2_02075 [Fervidicoccaceae archaeon]|jgi:hypothetical protein|uniref:Uncharacterized protein n=1 Tax=Fervidicoccus fontis TaxID=683846 RepID=A0A7C2YRF9_9CREN|nr:MAG: hypothetical protein C0179_06105 [Fervidicoccus sp.]HEU97314.1 hypothetical protein [Fervidicoccus fontis]